MGGGGRDDYEKRNLYMHNRYYYSLQVLIDFSDVFDRNFYICKQSEFSLYCSVIYVTSTNDQQAVLPKFYNA